MTYPLTESHVVLPFSPSLALGGAGTSLAGATNIHLILLLLGGTRTLLVGAIKLESQNAREAAHERINTAVASARRHSDRRGGLLLDGSRTSHVSTSDLLLLAGDAPKLVDHAVVPVADLGAAAGLVRGRADVAVGAVAQQGGEEGRGRVQHADVVLVGREHLGAAGEESRELAGLEDTVTQDLHELQRLVIELVAAGVGALDAELDDGVGVVGAGLLGCVSRPLWSMEYLNVESSKT